LSRNATSPERSGILYGVAAYAFWGVVPVYWKLLRHLPPLEVLAHRVVWGLLALAGFAHLRRRLPEVAAGMRDRRAVAAMSASGALLAVNWLTFIHAVNVGRLLHASLGYFINPLISVLIGLVFLRERLRPVQWAAVALAAAGVVQFAVQAGGLPWISLVLAITFGIYGLLRKLARVDALPGSTMETLLMAPIALAYLALIGGSGGGALGRVDAPTHALLFGTGAITALPLLWFAIAARRLPLSTVGFLQYLAPSGQFLLAVVAFGEPFSPAALRSFAFIWAALAVFSVDAWMRARASGAALRATGGEPPPR
jgi:chloramphenicol-sensitive protein RarD